MKRELTFFNSLEKLPEEYKTVLLFNPPDNYAVGWLENSSWCGTEWWYHKQNYSGVLEEFPYWALLDDWIINESL